MNAPGETFHISQGFEVLVPKSGPAYPIPCGEWERLKDRLQRVSDPPWLLHTIGAVLLSGTISVLIAIVTGTITSGSRALVVAWSVIVITTVFGISCLAVAQQQRRAQRIAVKDIVNEMTLIEKRYEGPEGIGIVRS